MCAKQAPSTPNHDSSGPPTDRNQQTSQSHSDVSPNLDKFKDNREKFESSDFESASAALTVIADRWIQQPRSHSGYLAYVIFVGPNTGVFYNWNAASSAHMGDDKVVFKGFSSIGEAHEAWDEYCKKKILPPGLAAPARGSRTLTYRGSPSQQAAKNSRTPQHTPAHSTARTSPPPYLSQNAAIRAHGHGSVSLSR